ncbi:MAG TPA: hypothetical protein VH661_00500 [Candidatus Dormibacteraeota bacterium]|jgi:hypothetical protein|nr:hypothetical protein [Candidatus Dormibacteraeota bacterium]
MATFVRNRVLNQLTWTDEEEGVRSHRRDVLCELDGLLTQLEEVNLRGGAVPSRVLIALRRRSVMARPGVSPAELIEAIFGVQEAFMRQPDGANELLVFEDLRRRIA